MSCRLLLEVSYLRLRAHTEIVELKENEKQELNFKLKDSFVVHVKTLRLKTDCQNRRK